MAYDRDLADRIREQLAAEPGVSEKAMFGGLAFLVEGHLAVSASEQGGLLLRVDPQRTDEWVAQDGADRFVMRGRPMDGWLRVAPEAVVDDAALQRWVVIGVDYARSLSPNSLSPNSLPPK